MSALYECVQPLIFGNNRDLLKQMGRIFCGVLMRFELKFRGFSLKFSMLEAAAWVVIIQRVIEGAT